MSDVQALLGNPGRGLVREVRPAQLDMARAIEGVIADGGLFCVEGPVGIGKTFAYLTPALYAGKRTVIATPTKSLQDQIINKDLPAIARALDKPIKAVVLKGKGNYGCKHLAAKHHIDDAVADEFFKISKYGDFADYPGRVPPQFRLATAERCIGRACPKARHCGFMRLKQDVGDANVIIINHHVLGAEFRFGLGAKTGGPYDVLVVDEAHHLDDGLRSAFTLTVAEYSARELHGAIGDTQFAPNIPTPALVGAWSQLFSLTTMDSEEPGIRQAPLFPRMVSEVVLRLDAIDQEIAYILEQYGCSGDPGDANFASEIEESDLHHDLVSLAYAKRSVDDLRSAISIMQGEAEDAIMDNTFISCSRSKQGVISFQAAPINMAGLARPKLDAIRSIVLTSATLAVDKSFGHLRETIGRQPTQEAVLPTVFNYRQSLLLYAPNGIIPVSRKALEYENYINLLVEECVALIQAAQGNTFVLCTAEDEMTALAERVSRICYDMNVFVQERDGSPKTIVEKFVAAKKPVLFGVNTFWEGVDIQGGKLRLVIIPKLPFPQQTKPLIVAKRRRFADSFEAWRAVDRVEMMIAVRQMAGRLIRSATDKGVVAILDGRLRTKSYGQAVMEAIYAFKRTDKRSDAERYLKLLAGYYSKLESSQESEVRA